MSAADSGVPSRGETATLAGGCFWCLEAVFDELEGVRSAMPGYMGGHTRDPTYREVCSGATGHAEVVQVVFDPGTLPYEELLEVFFAIHDPTTLDRQGPDVGTQYRSAIFYHSPKQKAIAEATIARLDAAGLWPAPIVTEVVPASTFYAAEPYHHRYFRRHPAELYCQYVIEPKLAKFRSRFAARRKRI
jgi:peptide-methionine (S)-S-oxide reductase